MTDRNRLTPLCFLLAFLSSPPFPLLTSRPPISAHAYADDVQSDFEYDSGDCEYECSDNIIESQCKEWAARGDCGSNPAFMLQECEKTCGACGRLPYDTQQELMALHTESCIDQEHNCPQLAIETDFCSKNAKTMLTRCRKSCGCCIKSTDNFGVLQKDDTENVAATRVMIRESLKYVHRIRNSIDDAKIRRCENRDEMCSFWASLGDCQDTEVRKKCMPACQSCHMIVEGECILCIAIYK